jgi:tripartite-type tricarboxylate transporter receptor subunit TctC
MRRFPTRLHLSTATAVLVAAFGAVTTTLAQSPATMTDKPVRIIATAAAGGALDIIARAVGQGLSGTMGISVIVENRAGASGSIASVAVAKAPADGHTLLLASPMSHSINPALNPKLPYDAVKDFTPICLVALIPQVLVVSPSLGINSLQEFVDYAKSHPGMTFGSAGNGSLHHLAGLKLASALGIQVLHIPYKGSGPALIDLVGGQINFMMVETSAAAQYVKAGRLKALAIATERRAPDLDAPTFAEVGYPPFQSSAWYAVFGPANLPDQITKKLNAEIVAALAKPEMRAQLETLGATIVGSSPSQLADFVKKDIADWLAVARDNNLTID